MEGVVDDDGRELSYLLLLAVGVGEVDGVVVVKNEVGYALAQLLFGLVELDDGGFVD